jgi:hypothetical protein
MQYAIGIVDLDKSEYKFKDAKIALRKSLEEIGKFEDANVTVRFFDNDEEYFKALKADEVQSIIFYPSLYLRRHDAFDRLHDVGWVQQEKNEVFFSYTLVGKVMNYESKKRLHVSYYEYDAIAKMCLEMIAKRDGKTFIYHPYKKESKAVIDTFFNKQDLAFVRTRVWELSKEMNPQIGKTMQTIKETEKKFFRLFSLMSKTVPQKDIKNFFDAIQRLDQTQGGKQLMQMFKFDRMHRITTKDLEPIKAFHREYQEMFKDRL